jgi:uncharacterized protein (TIGR01244 family)
MKSVAVSPKLAIAPQPKLSDFQEFKRQGFTMIVNNRPDGEDPNQPGSAAEEAAARAAGLDYVHIPVTSSAMTEEDTRRLKQAIEQAERATSTFGLSPEPSIHTPMRSCSPRRQNSASTPTQPGPGLLRIATALKETRNDRARP